VTHEFSDESRGNDSLMARKRGIGHFLAASTLLACAHGTGSAAGVNVVTYHNDTLRTGWNSAETTLTAQNVGGTRFGLLAQVALDEEVDAQPLVVSGVEISGSRHDVVYVVTANNSVYAVDAVSGAILRHVNLGPPVSTTVLPATVYAAPTPSTPCDPDVPSIGINSTPVIDLSRQTLFVMAYTSLPNTGQTYYLHALNLSTLADRVPPVKVAATRLLSDGKTLYSFNAVYSRQRPALLETNGVVYAGFGSFCDNGGSASRGWMMGWNASSLEPLANQFLANRVPNSILTSIWMSGAGPAADSQGNVYFVTSNSDTYANASALNLSESVVKWSPTTDAVSYFTPSDTGSDAAALDESDGDFGSGGVMLLPMQSASAPALAVAAGKQGVMYLLNQSNLGGKNSGGALGEYSIGYCACAPSYFQGADGFGRVVTSGDSYNFRVAQVGISSMLRLLRFQDQGLTEYRHSLPYLLMPPGVLMVDEAFEPSELNTGFGFFTSVSSNGIAPGSAVVWAVGGPLFNDDVTLYAYDGASGRLLYSGTAGTWQNVDGHANLVPTVANGRVYVAATKNLSIFGIAGPGRSIIQESDFLRPVPPPGLAPVPHQVYGFVSAVAGSRLDIRTRTGTHVTVDVSAAMARNTAFPASVGAAVLARGDYVNGTLQAMSLLHAKPKPILWRPDR
jgi:hypothetical protein